MSGHIRRVEIRPRHARPLFARHPWLYASSVASIDPTAGPGDEVSVFTAENKFVARGLYNPSSGLRVRLYRWEDQPLDDAFWLDRLERAIRFRTQILRLAAESAAYRLVSSEADGLSGLTVDRYDRWLVVQPSSLALAARLGPILERLLSEPGVEGAVVRWDRKIAAQEGMPEFEDVAHGSLPDEPIPIREAGLEFSVDLRRGQKTGHYLDQRQNREVAAGFARGRDVLDLFCYTGAFSLHALHRGASSALGIDRSAPALELARSNADRNGLTGATFQQSECFAAIDELARQGRRFGLVVCDPPKFAHSSRELEDALRGYVKLNRAAMNLVEPGGVLVTCSCSGHVNQEDFLQVLARSAEFSGREVRVLERRGASPDHPIATTCLESEYLKCYILAVD